MITASSEIVTVMKEPLIDMHLRYCRAAGLARGTLRGREQLLRRVDEALTMGLESATADELADWLAREGWALETRSSYYGHLRSFFRWACNPVDPKLDYDPSAALRRPKVPTSTPRPVTEDELAFALAVADEPWLLSVKLGAFAGLRAAEIAAIPREEINEQHMRVKGKGGKIRTVPTHHAVWAAVKDLPRGRIAFRPDGIVPDGDWLSTYAGRYFRSIGMPNVTIHRFRHRYGTMLLRSKALGGAGADLRTVQELMGHASPATTAKYTAITDEQRRLAIEALPVPSSAPC
jgi:integrase